MTRQPEPDTELLRIGVPFIARWPGKIAAGKVDKDSLISAVDLLPTFCELAGVTLPESYQPDGVSQVAALQGTPMTKREKPLFWKTPSGAGRQPFHWVAYAIMDQNWKLMVNQDNSQVELYDLVADPLESNEVKAEHPEVLKDLMGKLQRWKESLPSEADATCFSKERQAK